MAGNLEFIKSASTSSAVSELKVENCFSDNMMCIKLY